MVIRGFFDSAYSLLIGGNLLFPNPLVRGGVTLHVTPAR
jgi:hypothetical protein